MNGDTLKEGVLPGTKPQKGRQKQPSFLKKEKSLRFRKTRERWEQRKDGEKRASKVEVAGTRWGGIWQRKMVKLTTPWQRDFYRCPPVNSPKVSHKCTVVTSALSGGLLVKHKEGTEVHTSWDRTEPGGREARAQRLRRLQKLKPPEILSPIDLVLDINQLWHWWSS